MRMIALLDQNEGDIYNEPINEDAKSSIIENIYVGTRAYVGFNT
jgi:hypothetical protein